MNRYRRSLMSAALLVATASPLAAQAWAYPSFQPPRLVNREFNFGLAKAGVSGTTLLFQWREEAGGPNQLSLDAGLADPDAPRSQAKLFVGGQFARLLSASNADVPLDLMFTLGAYLAFGDLSLLRLPVGLSVGHRFDLGGGLAVLPYAHPRVSVDVATGRDNSDISVDFDLGLNFDLTRSLSLRASALFTGSSRFEDGFGVSVAWHPPGLVRTQR